MRGVAAGVQLNRVAGLGARRGRSCPDPSRTAHTAAVGVAQAHDAARKRRPVGQLARTRPHARELVACRASTTQIVPRAASSPPTPSRTSSRCRSALARAVVAQHRAGLADGRARADPDAAVVHGQPPRAGRERDPRSLLGRCGRRGATTALLDPVVDGHPDAVVVGRDRDRPRPDPGMPARAPVRSPRPRASGSAERELMTHRSPPASAIPSGRSPTSSIVASARGSASAVAVGVGVERSTIAAPGGSVAHDQRGRRRPRSRPPPAVPPATSSGPRRRRGRFAGNRARRARRGLRGQPRLGRRRARRGGAARDHPLGLARERGRSRRRARPGRGRPPTDSARPAPSPSRARPRRRTAPAGPARTADGTGGGAESCAHSFASSPCALERHAAGEREVQDAAERVHVGAGVDPAAADLLRRHVVERPDPLAGARPAAAA